MPFLSAQVNIYLPVHIDLSETIEVKPDYVAPSGAV